jgi:hypothetical protein
MGPAVQGRAGAVLELLEQFRRVALLEHELAHAPGVAVEDLGITLVVSRLADDNGGVRCLRVGPPLAGGP